MERIGSAIPALAALLAVTAGGCSGPPSSPSAPSPPPTASPSAADAPLSASDQAFVAGLLANHRQAVEIGELLDTKSGVDPQIRVLAEEISASQQQVVRRLEAWPSDAGDTGVGGSQPPPAPERTLPGRELEGLARAGGAQAGRLYLQAMVGSHIEATRMARTEVERGSDPAAVALAAQVVRDRGAEIDRMQVLLGGV